MINWKECGPRVAPNEVNEQPIADQLKKWLTELELNEIEKLFIRTFKGAEQSSEDRRHGVETDGIQCNLFRTNQNLFDDELDVKIGE